MVAYPTVIGEQGFPLPTSFIHGAPYPMITTRCANCSLVFLFPYVAIQTWLRNNPVT